MRPMAVVKSGDPRVFWKWSLPALRSCGESLRVQIRVLRIYGASSIATVLSCTSRSVDCQAPRQS